MGGSRPAVSKTGIDFAAIRPKDISTEAYVLYRAAQDIYEGTRYIGAAELVDRKLASGRMFRLIWSCHGTGPDEPVTGKEGNDHAKQRDQCGHFSRG